jgi:acetate kinase
MPRRGGRRRHWSRCELMDAILVVNAGSSSLKFQAFATLDEKRLNLLVKGQVDGVGTRPRMRAENAAGKKLVETTYTAQEIPDLPGAIQRAGEWLRGSQAVDLAAVGHRVVHGGPKYDRPVLITKEILRELQALIPLAPLHQPNNLAPVQMLLSRRPELPQVACFDTAFHRGQGPLADHYALPESYYAEGIRRYGFHGLSYEYIATHLLETAPEIANKRLIVAHLGSGASMCALSSGRSVESTLGFTALDGLPMGTRCGQIDPGVILYLISERKMRPAAVQDLLYRNCGLKGLSGVSNDVRELEASSNPKAAFALDYFVHRVGLFAGMLAAALGGVDAFVFTAGIGENSPTMRARIVEKIAWLGAAIDPAKNVARERLISSSESKAKVYVIPTDEELMIARHTLDVLVGRGSAAKAGEAA